MMVLQTLFFIWVYVLIDETIGLPTGAPCSQIETMTPQHKGGVTGRAPYRLVLSASCYQPGIAVKVTLRGIKGAKFKGFIIQARKSCTNSSVDRMGSFLDDVDKVHWRYQCSSRGYDNSVTHTWNDEKESVSVDWAVNSYRGEIVFLATVVEGYSRFYVQAVHSRPLRLCGSKLKGCSQTKPTDVEVTEKPEEKKKPSIPEKCLQPYKEGVFCPHTASEYEEQYWYDQKEGDCKHFWYRGCDGSQNRFDSKEKCETDCITAPRENKLNAELKRIEELSDICNQRIEPGKWCKPPGPEHHWGFKNGKCERFWYLGCNGNYNRFKNPADCEDACITHGCKRFVNKDIACDSWVKRDATLCGLHRGSGLVRELCQESCCRLRNRLRGI